MEKADGEVSARNARSVTIRFLRTGRNSVKRLLRKVRLHAIFGKRGLPSWRTQQPQETSMDFFFFFLGIAGVAAALYHLKKNNPNKQHH